MLKFIYGTMASGKSLHLLSTAHNLKENHIRYQLLKPSIDTRTEALVQKGMDALMKGRTVFVIAHRLSTVRNSDVIMVLDHGEIIERGSHEKLIEEKGKYYQLYTGAFELE